MSAFQWLILMGSGLLQAVAYAGDMSYEWVLEKYQAQEESAILSSGAGTIDGDRILAVITRDDMGELLTVFKQEATRYVGIAQTKSTDGFPSYVSTVVVTDNSLFLKAGNCHHGCFERRYQFKNLGGQFKLVGFEWQGDTLCTYYDEKNAPPDCNSSVRSGNSYNLLSSKTICWFEIQPASSGPRKTPKPFQPRGVQHEMRFSPIALPQLDGFDLDKFSSPRSCYFDYKRRVHVVEP